MAVESLGLRQAEAVSLTIEGDALVLRPAKARYVLEELVHQAKGLKAPQAIDDPAVGDEKL